MCIRDRYRDEKLSIKDASRKIREIVDEYLKSKGVDPKIPPTPLFDDVFLEKLKGKTDKAKAQELEYAIKEYIERHYEEDPEFYERFSDKLKKILKEYRQNWEILSKELESLREEMKKGRSVEKNFGLDPKMEKPFFGLLKHMVLGIKEDEELTNEEIEFFVNLTKDVTEIIKRESSLVDFWESYPKQKRLKSFIISHLFTKSGSDLTHEKIFKKRNEIAQRLLELAYHIYGKR